MDDDNRVTPESIERALETQLRERADFTIETGIPLSSDGRLVLHEQGDSDGVGSTQQSDGSCRQTS